MFLFLLQSATELSTVQGSTYRLSPDGPTSSRSDMLGKYMER